LARESGGLTSQCRDTSARRGLAALQAIARPRHSVAHHPAAAAQALVDHSVRQPDRAQSQRRPSVRMWSSISAVRACRQRCGKPCQAMGARPSILTVGGTPPMMRCSAFPGPREKSELR
jgi:hypothetical protein